MKEVEDRGSEGDAEGDGRRREADAWREANGEEIVRTEGGRRSQG